MFVGDAHAQCDGENRNTISLLTQSLSLYFLVDDRNRQYYFLRYFDQYISAVKSMK